MTDHEVAYKPDEKAGQGTREEPAGGTAAGVDAGQADEGRVDAAAEAGRGGEVSAAEGAGEGDGREIDADRDQEDGPVDGRDRLEALQEDIDEVRRRVADPTEQGENMFIQEGEADDDQPVDDTIAPPG